MKRTSSSGIDASGLTSGPSPFSLETMLTSSLRRRLSSPSTGDRHSGDVARKESEVSKARETLFKQIEPFRDDILSSQVSIKIWIIH